MITWSPGDVDVGIQSLLIQFYPILLSILLSVNRDQLATFDASIALLLSSSPLTTYLVVTSIADLCGINRSLQADQIPSLYHPYLRCLASTHLDWT